MGKKKHASHSPSLFENEDDAPETASVSQHEPLPEFPLPDDLECILARSLL